MTKHLANDAGGFGTRLVALRKAAGYTQQQLADELGVTRRMVAYYETESEHPSGQSTDRSSPRAQRQHG